MLVFFHANFSFAQIIISGKIIDAETKQAISNASISVTETTNGTTTKEDGNFILEVKKLPVTIQITHLTYIENVIPVSANNHTNLTIELQPKTYQISPVAVSPQKTKSLIDTSTIHIIDYEFHQDKILLLIHDYAAGHYSLMLITENRKPLFEKKLSEKPLRLFHDCMNFLHLVSKDYSYEIVIEEKNILLANATSTEKFNTILPRCIEELNSKYYINQYGSKKQALSYYYIEKENTSPVKIKEVVDEAMEKMWKNEARFANNMGFKYSEFDARFAELCVYKPIYAPLIKLNDSIYIFDYVNNRIEHYSSDHKITRAIPINYHQANGWEKDLFVDEKQNKLYVHFLKNSISTLKEVNVQTGETGPAIEISKMSFIENIKIRDGVIYFLDKSSSENSTRKIYSLKID